ncbi:D-glycero-beta-D-manno-heptose 1-phosphate adenylyltransferase [Membranihabitans maritimus]|uniref:D-glycero-beta-D-manno-heptose 1-phosphate adenylyltransferase n=1 Tax=Membranihabitans maritimus TaxID=2904244 RepID=UPI001F02357A|nr:D-glycero-beta-D-manno-heptose 1-phosphate adenylyltransferase [Membranihabitans maritimus]
MLKFPNKKFLNADNFQDVLSGRKQPLIWTNGCFDIVHRGHIEYLSACKNIGGQLIVGINSDESVKRLKGAQRPLVPEEDRMIHIAAFEFVDFVVMFEEDTPLNWIKKVRPDYLVKGGDYKPGEIVGNSFVKSYGGQVMTIPLTPGRSTSSIIDKILQDR